MGTMVARRSDGTTALQGTVHPGDAGRGEWPGPDSNRRHHDFQSCALPTELPRPGSARAACAAGRLAVGGGLWLIAWGDGLGSNSAGAGRRRGGRGAAGFRRVGGRSRDPRRAAGDAAAVPRGGGARGRRADGGGRRLRGRGRPAGAGAGGPGADREPGGAAGGGDGRGRHRDPGRGSGSAAGRRGRCGRRTRCASATCRGRTCCGRWRDSAGRGSRSSRRRVAGRWRWLLRGDGVDLRVNADVDASDRGRGER